MCDSIWCYFAGLHGAKVNSCLSRFADCTQISFNRNNEIRILQGETFLILYCAKTCESNSQVPAYLLNLSFLEATQWPQLSLTIERGANWIQVCFERPAYLGWIKILSDWVPLTCWHFAGRRNNSQQRIGFDAIILSGEAKPRLCFFYRSLLLASRLKEYQVTVVQFKTSLSCRISGSHGESAQCCFGQ